MAVDCGANTLKVAEFEPNESGGLRLKQYAFRSLGQEGAQEATRESATVKALQAVLGEKPFSSKMVNVCAPGFHVFSKFVKLPPVDEAKVTQIIQYEAQQNVPFPLEEVVWDYQILGATNSGDLEVLLVAIKTDVVEGLFRSTESSGLRLNLVEVSAAALCNAFRFNYGDLEGCTMLLDIGARTSSLLFFEKGKVFSRSINIGANTITQDFATEFRLSFDDAERIKAEKGFVSLGGAYEEPDDAQAAAISKIARQIMTRLHIQVNATIQNYRGQQAGSPPLRLFLSGGASIMPFTAQFFAEKLNIPVEYFNPLRNVDRDPGLNLEELAKVAHSMGELVGLGLRTLAHCPVELNLMPKTSVKFQEFNQKKPFFLSTIFSLVLVVFAYGFLQQKLVEEKRRSLDDLQATRSPLEASKTTLQNELRRLKEIMSDADAMRVVLSERRIWHEILPVLRECLMATEEEARKELEVDTGIWIDTLTTELPSDHAAAAAAVAAEGAVATDPGDLRPTKKRRGQAAVDPAVTAAASDQLITHLTLKVRSIDMTSIKPEGNNTMAFELLKQLQSHPWLFDTNEPNATGFKGSINLEGPTFTAEIVVKLKTPITL
ncbi:MAG: type IV pilus assembly protein PilM [Verrucomicrobiota bacterium]